MIYDQDKSVFTEDFLKDFSVVTRLAISSYYSPEEMKSIEVEIRFNPSLGVCDDKQDDTSLRTEAFIITPTVQFGCYEGEGPGCPAGQHYGSS
jgi:hypothetical protein